MKSSFFSLFLHKATVDVCSHLSQSWSGLLLHWIGRQACLDRICSGLVVSSRSLSMFEAALQRRCLLLLCRLLCNVLLDLLFLLWPSSWLLVLLLPSSWLLSSSFSSFQVVSPVPAAAWRAPLARLEAKLAPSQPLMKAPKQLQGQEAFCLKKKGADILIQKEVRLLNSFLKILVVFKWMLSFFSFATSSSCGSAHPSPLPSSSVHLIKDKTSCTTSASLTEAFLKNLFWDKGSSFKVRYWWHAMRICSSM